MPRRSGRRRRRKARRRRRGAGGKSPHRARGSRRPPDGWRASETHAPGRVLGRSLRRAGGRINRHESSRWVPAAGAEPARDPDGADDPGIDRTSASRAVVEWRTRRSRFATRRPAPGGPAPARRDTDGGSASRQVGDSEAIADRRGSGRTANGGVAGGWSPRNPSAAAARTEQRSAARPARFSQSNRDGCSEKSWPVNAAMYVGRGDRHVHQGRGLASASLLAATSIGDGGRSGAETKSWSPSVSSNHTNSGGASSIGDPAVGSSAGSGTAIEDGYRPVPPRFARALTRNLDRSGIEANSSSPMVVSATGIGSRGALGFRGVMSSAERIVERDGRHPTGVEADDREWPAHVGRHQPRVGDVPFEARDGKDAIGCLFDAGQPDRVDADESRMRLSRLGQASKPTRA